MHRRLLTAGRRLPVAGSRLSVAGGRVPEAGHRLSAAVRGSAAVRSAVGRGFTGGLRLLTVRHRNGAGHRLVAGSRLLRPGRVRSRRGRVRSRRSRVRGGGARLSRQRRPVVAA
ncbi:hypothetical protein DTL70_12130 [Streptomyces diacarni]|uniref:Uncharacterized protein n=1 Tax=Streptomyces diacarni TaxID=2800381 RepID=A0A367F1Z6_9ACTN|nr:hypothetical protein DTL70_12130 [Streptomyces diacarni]